MKLMEERKQGSQIERKDTNEFLINNHKMEQFMRIKLNQQFMKEGAISNSRIKVAEFGI